MQTCHRAIVEGPTEGGASHNTIHEILLYSLTHRHRNFIHYNLPAAPCLPAAFELFSIQNASIESSQLEPISNTSKRNQKDLLKVRLCCKPNFLDLAPCGCTFHRSHLNTNAVELLDVECFSQIFFSFFLFLLQFPCQHRHPNKPKESLRSSKTFRIALRAFTFRDCEAVAWGCWYQMSRAHSQIASFEALQVEKAKWSEWLRSLWKVRNNPQHWKCTQIFAWLVRLPVIPGRCCAETGTQRWSLTANTENHFLVQNIGHWACIDCTWSWRTSSESQLMQRLVATKCLLSMHARDEFEPDWAQSRLSGSWLPVGLCTIFRSAFIFLFLLGSSKLDSDPFKFL